MTILQRPRLTTLLAILLIFSAGLQENAWGTEQDIKILSADKSGLTLEIKLPPFEMKDIPGPDGTYRRILIDGWAKTSQAGYPEIPFKSTLIQLPEDCDMNFDIIDAEYEIIPDCLIYPVPKISLSDEGNVSTVFFKNDDIYRSPDFFSECSVKIDNRSVLRNVPVARVCIYPFQWNPETLELRYATRMLVRIAFDNISLPSITEERSSKSFDYANEPYDTLKKSLIVNYDPADDLSSSESSTSRSPLSEPASQEALKIEITEEGIYRITWSDLLTAGIDTVSIDPATLKLLNPGSEVATKVVTEQYIEFYGEKIDNKYTGTNVYWLCWGGDAGARINRVDGAVSGAGTALNSFQHVLHVEENHDFWALMPGSLFKDYWFWEKITAPHTSYYTINIPSPVSNNDDVSVRVYFQGRTTCPPHPNHHTKVYLNGTLIGDAFWDWEVDYIQEMTVKQSDLEVSNTITISSPGDTEASQDVIYLNWIEVDYLRNFEAIGDKLKFTVNGSGETYQITVRDMSTQNIRIFDITDPAAIRELSGFTVEADGANYKASFEAQITGEKTYCALTDAQIGSPAGIRLWQTSGLKETSNGADYIIITDEDFIGSVQPLCQLRENQGLRVKTVSTEEIYNEFNYGLFDPAAIKDFLKYAYVNWGRPAPAYVFLIGDANIDYRDYYGSGKRNRVPVHLSITMGLGLTPDDNWYVCMDGEDDFLPDMFIGRIPGSSATMVSGIINKIIGFEELTVYEPKNALFTADNIDMGFEILNEDLIGYLPADFNRYKVYLRSYGSNVDAATQAIISYINLGMLITNYVGHGSLTNWAGEFMFESSDVSLLNNGNKLTFVTAFDCINGYFSQSQPGNSFYSLGQEFVLASNKGAIGSFAPSGLGYTWEHEVLGKKFFSILFDERNNILGPLTTQSKLAAYAGGVSEDMVKMFTLFGDPATKLKWPKTLECGDIDGNGLVELADAILTLKVISGIPVSSYTYDTNADANKDGKTGFAEAIYVLQYLSGLRP
jgi:hypothetical protein